VEIESYPTLIFYGAGEKTGIPAEGKNFDELKKWLEVNSQAYKNAFSKEKGEKGHDEL
jgi:hypothetical protein